MAPLGWGEQVLLSINLGGHYYNPIEGRYRSAMTVDKALAWFINAWLLAFGLFWLWPILSALGPLIRLIETSWLWMVATAAPVGLAMLFRYIRRQR